jgi:hypothetical protein
VDTDTVDSIIAALAEKAFDSGRQGDPNAREGIGPQGDRVGDRRRAEHDNRTAAGDSRARTPSDRMWAGPVGVSAAVPEAGLMADQDLARR